MAGRPARRPKDAAEPPGPNQAVEIAARFLATRPRSAWEVRRRLERAAADAAVVEEAMARLEALGLVDDIAFARWWREQRDRHAPRGRRMLEAELRTKGVPRDVIAILHDETPTRLPEEADLPATEADRAREALDAHLRGRPVPVDRRGEQRLGMFLVRRGFDPATARDAIRERAALEATSLDGAEDAP